LMREWCRRQQGGHCRAFAGLLKNNMFVHKRIGRYQTVRMHAMIPIAQCKPTAKQPVLPEDKTPTPIKTPVPAPNARTKCLYLIMTIIHQRLAFLPSSSDYSLSTGSSPYYPSYSSNPLGRTHSEPIPTQHLDPRYRSHQDTQGYLS
jgi:hypothetical protein